AGLPRLITDEFHVSGTQLVVTGQPAGVVTAGAGFAVTVTAEDSYGNVDRSFQGSVTLALANHPGGATLGGTRTVNAVNGVASFSGLTLSTPGTGYTLQATSAGLTATTSRALDVMPPGVATHLVLTTPPPSSVAAGTNFGLTVMAEDSRGVVDTSFNGTVTLVLNNYSGSPTSTLGGTRTLTAVNGVAAFSGLMLNGAGYYSLSVRSGELPVVMTNGFSVIP